MRRVALGFAVLVALGLPAIARAVDLEGYWYVLVHYQDMDTNKPEAWRWEDRVWRFHKSGDRLEWTDWPIVSLRDESGRFENLSGNRAARVVAAWEPNAEQLADIKDGLAANSRGEKTKKLRASAGGTGWESGDGAGGDSAMVITYSENWSIRGLPDAPVFMREDSMGSASTESMDGTTQYRTEEVRDGGEELVGSFDRDGSRTGRFRMIRSGEVGRAGTDSLEDRQRQGVLKRAVESGYVTPDEVAAMMGGQVQLPNAAKGADREQARAAIRKAVEDAVKANGNDPSSVSSQIERITGKIERALFDHGKSIEDVQAMISRGEIGP
jgi:hypothetical protein